MNKKTGNIYNKIYILLFGLLAFSIPLFDRFAAMTIVLIMFTWVIEGKFKKKFQRIRKEKYRVYILSFSIIYLIYLIGFFYSKNQYYAFLDLQTKLSLLIFPLLFATIDENIIKNKIVKILFFYILGCFVVTLVLIFRSFYNFLESHSLEEFFYARLCWYHHASYLAMFLVFAIGILFYWFYNADQKFRKKYQIIGIILIIYFSFFVLLLSSKAAIISLLIVFLCHIGFLIVKKKYIWSVLMLLVYIFTLWGSSNYLMVTSNRLITATHAISSDNYDKNSTESTTGRIFILRSALSIIKENLIFGVGTGDANDKLIESYKVNQYTGALKNRLNAHNQYLQTFIAIGLVGFLVLMGTLFIPLFQAIRNRNIIYILLLSLVIFNLLFESMFERQAGIVFYSFFNGLLFSYIYSKNDLTTNTVTSEND